MARCAISTRPRFGRVVCLRFWLIGDLQGLRAAGGARYVLVTVVVTAEIAHGGGVPLRAAANMAGSVYRYGALANMGESRRYAHPRAPQQLRMRWRSRNLDVHEGRSSLMGLPLPMAGHRRLETEPVDQAGKNWEL